MSEFETDPEVETPTAPPRRRQADRRAESRFHLLAAAVHLIVQQGVAAVTLEKIGAKAGYSRGLATQKFGSKQGLIEVLITHLHGRLEEMMRDAQLEEMLGLQGILTFAGIFLREMATDDEVRAYFMLMAASVADQAPGRAVFAMSHDIVKHKLTDLVIRGQQDGTILQGLDPTAMAILVGSLLLGFSTQSLVDPNMNMYALHDSTLAAINRALAAPSGELPPDGELG